VIVLETEASMYGVCGVARRRCSLSAQPTASAKTISSPRMTATAMLGVLQAASFCWRYRWSRSVRADAVRTKEKGTARPATTIPADRTKSRRERRRPRSGEPAGPPRIERWGAEDTIAAIVALPRLRGQPPTSSEPRAKGDRGVAS
jgi:hypothetical protein